MTKTDYVYCYTVCWLDSLMFPCDWKHKDFASFSDAEKFAQETRAQEIEFFGKIPHGQAIKDPYIVRSVEYRGAFREDVETEEAPRPEMWDLPGLVIPWKKTKRSWFRSL